MAKDSIAGLVAQLYNAKINRREFGKRAAAAGLSAGLIGQALAVHATRAQDVELPPAATIGQEGFAASSDTSKGTIKIYSSWPLTGTMELTGGDAVVAAQMAFDDFGNASGGYELVYEALDEGVAANNGGWEAGKVTENANKAINDAEAMVYMGTYNSGSGKIAIPILNQAGMAMISFANTYPGLTVAVEGATEEGEPEVYYPTGVRNYMRVCPADQIQGGAGARWAYEAQERRMAYVLDDNSLYGKGVATVFRNTFEELGGEILGAESYEKSLDNYQTLMTSIADKGPDIVYLGATVENNAAKILQDMRGVMGEEVIFLGSDGLNNQTFVDGAADAANGAWITFGGYTPDKLLELGGAGGDYVTRVTEKLGHSPDAYSVYSYETAVAVIQAIGRAGTNDRTAILDELFGTENFNSLLGFTWSFNENGDTDNSVIGLSQVIDNQIAFQEAIS
ncbi:MAG: branched-chain amino acid ABC transporter substrate-binding protein [Thermomicrobiales bacterium]|nr:branched-chain amino acid ABC transporter substrate-binding protein [Thermomicrobiales bacterium]MCO5220609.1 branched-chain amino acid ABC transporter substrate-binding protein [Thermomicrobiales bacterium]